MQIIRRNQWGARPPRSVSRTIWTTDRLWVHHSAGAKPLPTLASETAMVRGIQSFHMGPARGWADIGYAYLIAPDSGRVYEGRGQNVWAAHCPGRNNEPSVCIMGTFDASPPADAARRSVWMLADYLGLRVLMGHRQGHPTSCPGDALMRSIVNAPRPMPAPSAPAETPRPYSNTLRLVLNGRAWAGWDDAAGPLAWIARHGLKADAETAIAWRGNVWRGPRDVTNVARTLAAKFL